MARIRERVTEVLFKLESTVGVDAAAGVGDYLRVIEGTGFDLNPELDENNEFRGGLGAGEHTVGGLLPTQTIISNIRGSGVAATPPEVAALMEAAAYVETVHATANTATVATAGTSTTVTVVRGADWPTGSGIASGMIGRAVVLTGNPAAATFDVITDYVQSGANATITLGSTYATALSTATSIQRLPQVVYESGTPTPHKSGSFYGYLDGILQKFFGCRGSHQTTWNARRKCTHQFSMNGFDGLRTDVNVLANPTDDPTSPPIWTGGLLTINRKIVCASQLSMNLNMAGTYPSCPSALEGVDAYEVTGRRVTLTVNPDLTLVATANNVAALKAGTVMPIVGLLGKQLRPTVDTPGERIFMTMPKGKMRSNRPGVRDGFRDETLEFGSTDVNNEIIWSFF